MVFVSMTPESRIQPNRVSGKATKCRQCQAWRSSNANYLRSFSVRRSSLVWPRALDYDAQPFRHKKSTTVAAAVHWPMRHAPAAAIATRKLMSERIRSAARQAFGSGNHSSARIAAVNMVFVPIDGIAFVRWVKNLDDAQRALPPTPPDNTRQRNASVHVPASAKAILARATRQES